MNAASALAAAAAFGVGVTGADASELDGGYSNDVWLVRAPAGAFTVRRYGRLHVTRAALLFEHGLIEHVAARMPEVAAPLRDIEGRTLQLIDGAFVAVFPFIAGTTGARDDAAAHDAARLLARYHRAAADVHVASGMRSSRMLGVLPWLRERFQQFAAEGTLRRRLPWDALIEAVSASAAAVPPLLGKLPHVVVHGDPNPHNVVRRDGAAVGLIDFDFAHETERVYDLAVLLDEFGRTDEDAPLAVERLGAMLDAYAEEAPIGGAERRLVPESMIRRNATLVWYVVTRHGERSAGDIGGAPRYAGRVREIHRRREEIRAAVEFRQP